MGLAGLELQAAVAPVEAGHHEVLAGHSFGGNQEAVPIQQLLVRGEPAGRGPPTERQAVVPGNPLPLIGRHQMHEDRIVGAGASAGQPGQLDRQAGAGPDLLGKAGGLEGQPIFEGGVEPALGKGAGRTEKTGDG